MNLTIITACWKRPEVFEMFAQGVKALQEHFEGRMNITVTCAGSEGQCSKTMVEAHNFTYLEHSNKFLGQKMNQASIAAKQHSPDYCLFLGSDDIMAPNVMEVYYDEMVKGIDYLYVKDFYFFDTVTKKALYWRGYDKNNNRGDGCGAGRVLSHRILNGLAYKPWFDTHLHGQLDTAFDMRYRSMRGLRPKEKAFFLRDIEAFGLDIKSITNMTPFELWPNTLPVDAQKMLFDNLPDNLAKQIYG